MFKGNYWRSTLSAKYNMLFPKLNIRNQKLKQTLGILSQFLWQRVQETSAISIALPPHLSLALQLYKSKIPKLFFTVNSVEMMTQRRNCVPFWSHKGTRERQYWALVMTLVSSAAETVTTGHNHCPTFGSDRHRGLGWGLKCKDQIKESSSWIFLRSPPCHAPKGSQGFAMDDDDEGTKSSSYQAVHTSAF